MQNLVIYILLLIIGSITVIFMTGSLPAGLLNGFLYGWLFAVKGWNGESILSAVCVSVLMLIGITDYRTYEIPVKYNVIIGILGFIRTILDLQHWYDHGIGLISVSGLLFLVYLISEGKAVGGGDIKLMAVSGLLMGWKNIFLALFAGSVTACIIHLILMKLKGRNRVLAFGPYLSFGIIFAMLYGEQIMR